MIKFLLERPERFFLVQIDSGTSLTYTVPLATRARLTFMTINQEQLTPDGIGFVELDVAGVVAWRGPDLGSGATQANLSLQDWIALPEEAIVINTSNSFDARFWVALTGSLYFSLD